ncbi:MAG: rRNA maturation RNase YbeY [Candidatus Cryptobacteroides sp.]
MISYFLEDTNFKFNTRRRTSRWLKSVAKIENRSIGEINIIFCSDPYILDLNIKSLDHHFFTDIITFDYCEGDILSGDLYISVDTVRANAEFYNTDFDNELYRVIVHGLLHLIGYDDHSDEEIAVMRSKEDFCLNLLQNI